MQWNGSSCLSTLARASAARKSSCGVERDHLFRARRLAQSALHAGVFGEPQRRALRIVAERAGRAGGNAGEAERAAFDIDRDGAEWRAGRQRDHVGRRGRGVVQFAQRLAHARRVWADRREPRRRRGCRGQGRDRATTPRRARTDRRSRWSPTRSPVKPSPRRIGSASANVFVKPGDIVPRPCRAAGNAATPRHRRKRPRSLRGRPA